MPICTRQAHALPCFPQRLLGPAPWLRCPGARTTSPAPPTCRKRASSMRAPMRLFISSSFFSLSSNVEGSMLGNSFRATCRRAGAGRAGGCTRPRQPRGRRPPRALLPPPPPPAGRGGGGRGAQGQSDAALLPPHTPPSPLPSYRQQQFHEGHHHKHQHGHQAEQVGGGARQLSTLPPAGGDRRAGGQGGGRWRVREGTGGSGAASATAEGDAEWALGRTARPRAAASPVSSCMLRCRSLPI